MTNATCQTYGYLSSRRASLCFHRNANDIKFLCPLTEAHVCEQLAQSGYLLAERLGEELATFESQVQCLNHYTTRPH